MDTSQLKKLNKALNLIESNKKNIEDLRKLKEPNINLYTYEMSKDTSWSYQPYKYLTAINVDQMIKFLEFDILNQEAYLKSEGVTL